MVIDTGTARGTWVCAAWTRVSFSLFAIVILVPLCHLVNKRRGFLVNGGRGRERRRMYFC